MSGVSLMLYPLHIAIIVYIWIIIVSAIFSFLQVDPRQPLVEILERITQPAFTFIREKMPFVVVSSVDLSPIVLIVGLQLIDNIILGGILYAFVQVVHSLIFTAIIIVIIASVVSLLHINPYNPIVATLNRLTQPIFQWVRRKMPFLVVGNFDLSPLVIIIGLQIVDGIFGQLLLGFK